MSERRNSNLLRKITILVMCCFVVNTALALDGSGTQENPWRIRSLEDFNDFAADPNYWDDYTRLETDVNLAGRVYDRPVIEILYFGVFDGNDHKIMNLNKVLFGTICHGQVSNLGLEGGSVWISGLVQELYEGTISNCYFNGSVTGGMFTGGLVGCNSYGNISNCYSAGDVSGSWYVGGLVGINAGTITNSYSTGFVNGAYYVGGLVGDSGGTISNCYFNGSVTGDSYVGGLVGDSKGTISNCYFNGSATGDWYVGGLVGKGRAAITGCYAMGSVTGYYEGVGGLVGLNIGGGISNCFYIGDINGVRFVGGLVGSNYSYLLEVSNCFSMGSVSGVTTVGGLVGSNMGNVSDCYFMGSASGDTSVGGLVGFNSDNISNCYSTGDVNGVENTGGLVGRSSGGVSSCFWDTETQTHGITESIGLNEGDVNNVEGLPTAQMQDANTFIDAGWGCGAVWTIDNGTDYPRFGWEYMPGEPLIPRPYEGIGTESDPFLIYTAEQLNSIGLTSCDLNMHFKLMADIDLGQFDGRDGREKFNIIGEVNDVWNQLDPNYKPFTGIFDGNGHTISNFIYDSNNIDAIGLFRVVNDGEIRNLGLINPNVDAGTGGCVGSLIGYFDEDDMSNCYAEGGSVRGGDYIGGLVGCISEGDITNCYSDVNVYGVRLVGGLIGVFGGEEETLINCYSAGSVSGTWRVGGLVGGFSSEEGIITNCYATGNVSGDNKVGGLVGEIEEASIINCYSAGSVSGTQCVGGLLGENSESSITNCYSIGSVSGERSVGGLLGYNDEGKITCSFWDIQTSGIDEPHYGIGLPTDQLQLQSTFTDAGWDFDTPVWTIDEGIDYPRLWWEFVPVLYAEPEATLGTTNTISWEPINGNIKFYTECSIDPNFTNILYSSGWITETSYEFTGLQLDQRYWYSVKARNSAGIESQWSNLESSLQCSLSGAVETLLNPKSLKNENMKNALLNKIDETLDMINRGNYKSALNKLENDILPKTNGCAETGKPDKSDWIITCEEQSIIYPLIIETIEYVKGLME